MECKIEWGIESVKSGFRVFMVFIYNSIGRFFLIKFEIGFLELLVNF